VGIEHDGRATIERITSIKIFLWQVPEFSRFICRSALALESRTKIFLGDPEDNDDAIEERDVVAESGR